MNKFLFTLLLIAFSSFLPAQIMNGKGAIPKSNNLDLDKIISRFVYEQISTPDTSKAENKKENTMYLEIGNNVSKYYDSKDFIADSIRVLHERQGMNADKSSAIIVPLLRGKIDEVVFKNYPAGKITVTDRIPFSTYKYEESIETPNWKLVEGALTVCGYGCKKATTTFRGRAYTAWYAPEIPISDGPWKFTGLPGLIMKVEDDKHHYSFECIGIEQPKNQSIYFSLDYRYINTTKKEFNKGIRGYYKNPGAHIDNTGLVKSEMPAHVYKSKPYNPIELTD